jgi:hypothetical protein
LAACENAFSQSLWNDSDDDETDLKYINKRKESPNTLIEIADQKIKWKKLKIEEIKTFGSLKYYQHPLQEIKYIVGQCHHQEKFFITHHENFRLLQ